MASDDMSRDPIPLQRTPEMSPTARTPVVERAKGLLMFRHGIPSFQAFALLLQYARTHGFDVTTAAERLVAGAELDAQSDSEARPGSG